jgi:hypothetical protein
MLIWEVLGDVGKAIKPKLSQIAKSRKPKKHVSDFEKNARQLRRRERELNAVGPVSPIKHRP